MDAERFDRLLLTLTGARSRRSVLGLLGASGLTGLLARDVAGQTCLANGTRCGGGRGTCCSGRCVRKRGTTKKFCRQAPGQGICTIEDNQCGAGSPTCNATGTSACACFVTSRGFSFCGSLTGTVCFTCTSDVECVNRSGGQAGDRCVPAAHPVSCCAGSTGGVCVHACPDPATA